MYLVNLNKPIFKHTYLTDITKQSKNGYIVLICMNFKMPDNDAYMHIPYIYKVKQSALSASKPHTKCIGLFKAHKLCRQCYKNFTEKCFNVFAG